MLTGYYIDEQKDGRGEDAEMVLIKQVKKGVSTDAKGKIAGMFPLKSVGGKQLPCLKVVVSNGSPDHRFEVRCPTTTNNVATTPASSSWFASTTNSRCSSIRPIMATVAR